MLDCPNDTEQSPLNNSTAKQRFSFTRSSRFKNYRALSFKTDYNIPSTLTKKSCGFGIGKRNLLLRISNFI